VGLFYGQRALCIGALHPIAYTGTSTHSGGKLAPFKRLTHTALAFESIFFGSRAEADRVLEYVRRMHERVNGMLPLRAGVYPAGTRYDAFDPELMLWTVAVIADSAQRFYELFVRRLRADEREALWQEYLRFGELFGMPRAECPATYGAFRTWYEGELASERVHLTEEARYVGHATAFEIPMSRARQPAKRVHDAIMLGALPARVRAMYGLPYGPRARLEFEAGVQALRTARRLAPRPLTRGSCAAHYEGVAATERWRIEHGRPTPQVTPEMFGSRAAA
jgi:uncharacterized protein (DUF2236 family)